MYHFGLNVITQKYTCQLNKFGLKKLIKIENFNSISKSGFKIFNPYLIKIENFNPNLNPD